MLSEPIVPTFASLLEGHLSREEIEVFRRPLSQLDTSSIASTSSFAASTSSTFASAFSAFVSPHRTHGSLIQGHPIT